MFEKILYPTDFSKNSSHALSFVKKLAEAGTEIVLLVHCVDEREINTMADMEGFSSIQYTSIVDDVREELKKRATKSLSKITQELSNAGFKVEERLVVGIPFREILEIAEKEKVNAIVIGSTGKGVIKEILLGSTSEKVVREAKCPVLVVK